MKVLSLDDGTFVVDAVESYSSLVASALEFKECACYTNHST